MTVFAPFSSKLTPVKLTLGALLLCTGAVAMAQPPIIQPGPPGQPGRIISAEEASDLAGLEYSRGDIMFLRGMISHHAQAKEMSELADERTNNEAVLALAERIFLSQDDEISMMQAGLEDRPDAGYASRQDFMLMPGRCCRICRTARSLGPGV
ncbi:MAG: DUF305 domain-containing protein [Pseudohongiellaceae bacterium]